MNILNHTLQSRSFIGLAILMAMLNTTYAAETEAVTESEAKPLWELNAGAFMRYGPAYPASEDSQFNFVPAVIPIYRGKVLRVADDDDKPITTRIFRNDRLKLNVDFGLNFAVDSDDVDARFQMPDLDLLLEAGPQLEIKLNDNLAGGRFLLGLQLRGAVSFDGLDPEWRGTVYSTELKYIRPLAKPGSEYRIKLMPEWGSSDYMDFFYGVEPIFETATRSAYRAKSGYLGTGLSVSYKTKLTQKIQIGGGVKVGLHNGAANENSPLFTDKSTYSVVVGFVWNFWESQQREVTSD